MAIKNPIITSIDLFVPIWIIIGLLLCFTNKVDWWVLILLLLSRFELKWKKKKGETDVT